MNTLEQYASSAAAQYQYGQLPDTGGVTIPMIACAISVLVASVYFLLVLIRG
jgi:hypothetical protein